MKNEPEEIEWVKNPTYARSVVFGSLVTPVATAGILFYLLRYVSMDPVAHEYAPHVAVISAFFATILFYVILPRSSTKIVGFSKKSFHFRYLGKDREIPWNSIQSIVNDRKGVMTYQYLITKSGEKIVLATVDFELVNRMMIYYDRYG